MIDTPGLQAKWDNRYRANADLPAPALVLAQNAHLLPRQGRALDLACGLGANALFLAGFGLSVEAWDLSPVAIQRLSAQIGSTALTVQVRDVVTQPPEPDSFDVIVVSHFLERSLAPALSAALHPGGLIFYQTFTREAASDSGPSNPDYRLAANELLKLFPDLLLRIYREEGRVGDLSRGCRDLALLVAQRPL